MIFPRTVFAIFAAMTFVFGQGRDSVADPPDRDAIARAIGQLSDRRYKVRNEATERLWQMGPDIESALVELSESVDPESQERIASIRRKFALGLTPDTPRDTRATHLSNDFWIVARSSNS